MLSWLWDNVGSLLLALVLAITVWIAAVIAEDPIQERPFPSALRIERRDLGAGLLIVNDAVEDAQITLRAPRSVWERLTPADIKLWVDLRDLGVGEHRVEVQVEIEVAAVRLVSISPGRLSITLESAASAQIPIEVLVVGETAVGFRAEPPVVEPDTGVVTGPASAVTRVASLLAEVDLAGRQQDLSQEVDLLPVDSAGEVVEGVAVNPNNARVSISIETLGGYRSVVVNPRIVGEVRSGYQPTKITVSPTFVTVFSANPEIISDLGGFVETEAISLQDATSDIETRVQLDLPDGVSVVGDQSVIVRVEIEAIESFLTLSPQLIFQGLGPGLFAIPSPSTVSLLLNGPLPVLEGLESDDVQIVLDLTGFVEGVYQVTITPENIFAPSDVIVQTILPETIEITITSSPPPSPTPTATPVAP